MKGLLFNLLIIASCLIAHANQDTILVGAYASYTPPYLFWSPAKNETYIQAINSFRENKFSKWGKRMAFTKGITNESFWVLLIVKDTSIYNHKYLWSFYQPSCAYEFYEFDTAFKLLNKFTASTYQPITQRPFPARSVSFPFNILKGQTKFLLVKAQSTNTDALYLDQDLATQEEFLKWEIGYSGLINRYLGFFTFAMLINLLLYFFIRKNIYGWLCAYILFFLMYNICDFSFDALLFNEFTFRKLILIPKFTWIIGATACSLMVFNIFTNQKKEYPRLYKISLLIIKFLFWAFHICILAHEWSANHQSLLLISIRYMCYLILSCAIAFQIWNLFYLSYKKNKTGILFLFSSMPLIISALLYIFYLITSINIFVIWPSNVIISSCYEIILLTIIFTFDYRNKNRERNYLLNESIASERKITSAILYSQEQERKRIAQDLHDEIGSTLAALKLRLQKSKLEKNKLDLLLQIIDKASSDTRNISHNLMPPEFEKTSLKDLLLNHYAKLNAESTVHFNFHIAGVPLIFPKEVELMLYRILMELTGNILKHSGASEATIQLIYYQNHLEIMTEDNGKGIVNETNGGIGLKNVHSRVNYLAGTIKIDSSYLGTTTIINIPFKFTKHE